jgi:hypothetical protein
LEKIRRLLFIDDILIGIEWMSVDSVENVGFVIYNKILGQLADGFSKCDKKSRETIASRWETPILRFNVIKGGESVDFIDGELVVSFDVDRINDVDNVFSRQIEQKIAVQKFESTPPDWWFESILKKAKVKQEVLLQCLVDVKRVLEEEKVTFFLTGGSLLGLVRHEGFIPHDDDVDLGCFEEELPKLKKAMSQLQCRDMGLSYWEKIEFLQYVFFEDTPNQVIIDFFYRKRAADLDDRFLKFEEVASLTHRSFCGHQMPCPADPIPYLNRLYPNWENIAIVFSHQDTFSINNVWKVDLNEYLKLIQELNYEQPKV